MSTIQLPVIEREKLDKKRNRRMARWPLSGRTAELVPGTEADPVYQVAGHRARVRAVQVDESGRLAGEQLATANARIAAREQRRDAIRQAHKQQLDEYVAAGDFSKPFHFVPPAA